jgi:hypothetical protein
MICITYKPDIGIIYISPVPLYLCIKKAFTTLVPIFNKLPSELKELVQTPEVFKSSSKRYLVLHSFYNLEEFYCMNGQCVFRSVSYLIVFLFLCLWLCYVLLYIMFIPWLVPMITGTMVLLCDSYYIQRFCNFTTLYQDQLEFKINWTELNWKVLFGFRLMPITNKLSDLGMWNLAHKQIMSIITTQYECNTV